MNDTPVRPSILIIYTGGTIGMIRDPETGTLMPFNFEQISKQVPELKLFGYELSALSFEKPIDSSDINPLVWAKLANIILAHQHQYDGFVVLHGSDTMAFTASALSFALHNLKKPIIFTGAQLPIGTLRTDGKENLITAIEIAASQKNGQPTVPEVCIYFENKLYRGNRTTKHNAEHFNAFASANYPFLAQAGVNIVYNYTAINYARNTTSQGLKCTPVVNYCPDVAIIKLFPGIRSDLLTAVFSTPDLKGVVLETYGSGNAPTDANMLATISTAIEREIVIVNVTQCAAGHVDMERYNTGTTLAKTGIISGYDLTTEAAITKLMFLLGQNLSYSDVLLNIKCPIAGEMTVE